MRSAEDGALPHSGGELMCAAAGDRVQGLGKRAGAREEEGEEKLARQ